MLKTIVYDLTVFTWKLATVKKKTLFIDWIVNSLEGGCFVGNSVLWMTVWEDGWQGERTEKMSENVQMLFQIYYLLELWSTPLNSESVLL